MAVSEQSSDVAVPAVEGTHTVGGTGVRGAGASGVGVAGSSVTGAGLEGQSARGSAVHAVAHGAAPAADFLNDDPSQNAGPGLRARSAAAGVIGESSTWMGVVGVSRSTTGGHGMMGQAIGPGAGVVGDSTEGIGVIAVAHGAAPGADCSNDDVTDAAGPGLQARSRGAGVIGLSQTWMGVFGETRSVTGGHGVMGSAIGPGVGVMGQSTETIGVLGRSTGGANGTVAGVGVRGEAVEPQGNGPGVVGESFGGGPGVLGLAPRAAGVSAIHGDPRLQETTVSNDGARAGLFAASENGAGVVAYARDRAHPAVLAFGGLRAVPMGRPFAAEFLGTVKVEDVLLSGADCAELFDLEEGDLDAGDVVVISPSGRLRRSVGAYDRTVAGVVSGAGPYRPGIVLNGDVPADTPHRPVALVGRVMCKVAADDGGISVGDLLTTSDVPGHAMAAKDRRRAFGSVLGKSLGRLAHGTGLLPVLVALQ
jgi:hypothetical protein